MLSIVLQIPGSKLGTAALLGIVNLLLFVSVAENYAKRWDLLILATASVLLFTPAGYYFNAYSSEGWIIFLTLCGLYCIEWNRRDPNVSYHCAFFLRVTGYFLLLVKIVNIIIYFALLVIFLLDFYALHRLARRSWQLLTITFALAVPAIIAVGFLATYNHVTSGSFFYSPYILKDAEYSSFSLGHFKIIEVLFSSWHGLFFYHPLLAVPIYWLIRAAKVDPTNVIVLVAVALQMVVQSSWHLWWMGLGTYGARGFCGVSILLIYAVLRCHQERIVHILSSSRSLLILGAFATFEAYLISKGLTNFTDYNSFIHDARMPSSLFSLAIFFSYGVAVFCIGRWLALDTSRCSMIYVLGLYPLASLLLWKLLGPFAMAGTRIAVLIVAVLIVATIILAYRSFPLHFLASLISIASARYSARILFASTACAFLFSLFAQAVMLTTFSARAVSNFTGGQPFVCPVIALSEYNMIQGYQKDKAALFAFLTRSGCFTTTQPVPAIAEPPK